MCVCSRVCRPEFVNRCVFSVTLQGGFFFKIFYCFETESVTELGACLFGCTGWSVSARNSPVSPFSTLDYRWSAITVPGLYCGSWGSNRGTPCSFGRHLTDCCPSSPPLLCFNGFSTLFYPESTPLLSPMPYRMEGRPTCCLTWGYFRINWFSCARFT